MKNSRDKRPYVRPVTRIELSQTYIWLRVVLFVILLAIAACSIGYGINSFLSVQPGWQTVEASPSKPNCSSEFVLMYDFSDDGANAVASNKRLISLYTESTTDAFSIFSPDVHEEGLYNVGYINDHVNDPIVVHSALYQALQVLDAADNRCIFLAPVYREYDRIFQSESDPAAASFDPKKDPEVKQYIDQMLVYMNDPEMVSIALLGDNRICLKVSEEYLTFAQENAIDQFVDFGWMKNAFIADYLAERLSENGFTNFYLSSYDGFTRNLDSRSGEFKINIFDLQGTEINNPARMTYTGPMSIVSLRSYPMDELDQWRIYTYADGEMVTNMIDPLDGISKSAISDLTSYSKNLGCGELLMKMIPVYLTDVFSPEAVLNLSAEGIHSVWCENNSVFYHDETLKLENLTDAQGNSYEVKLEK